MNRQQLSLVVVLGLISSTPTLAADPSEQGGGWRTASAETAASTLSGKLYRNSADRNGSAPYVVVDRWGVTRGYVRAVQGVELESCLGQQVSLQGTVKTLPGGDMPFMICQQILGGNAEESPGVPIEHNAATAGREAFIPVAEDQRVRETTARRGLPMRDDMSASPAPARGRCHCARSCWNRKRFRRATMPRIVPRRRRGGPINAARLLGRGNDEL